MALTARSVATLAALAGMLGCASTRTPSAGTTLLLGVLPAFSATSVSPVPPPDVATAVPPPVEDADDSLDRCRAEEELAADRVSACLRYLDRHPQSPIFGPNVVSERAEAILSLHALGHQIPLTTTVQRALRGALTRCVAVHDDPESGVVSLACRTAVCGDA